jgi:uncharacterized protein (TIGR03435 family)
MKLAAFFLPVAMLAQTPPAFEASVIKLAAVGRQGGGLRIDPARVKFINVPFKFLVQSAFNVKDFQVSGANGWMDTEHYDIDAVAASPFKDGEMRLMIQSMLAERFGMAFHRETLDRPGYALVVAKGGQKLPPPIEDRSMLFSRTPNGDVTFAGKNVDMPGLASALASRLGAIVVDKTGIEGRYDVSFQWTPDASTPVMGKNGEPAPPPPPDAIPGPSIFTAIQEKLGLRLESRKVPVEVIVIDKANRPTEN